MVILPDQPEPSSAPPEGESDLGQSDRLGPEAAEPADPAEPWQLNPARFPRHLELDLSPSTLRRLQDLAERSGRDLNEIILALLDQQLGSQRDDDEADPETS